MFCGICSPTYSTRADGAHPPRRRVGAHHRPPEQERREQVQAVLQPVGPLVLERHVEQRREVARPHARPRTAATTRPGTTGTGPAANGAPAGSSAAASPGDDARRSRHDRPGVQEQRRRDQVEQQVLDHVDREQRRVVGRDPRVQRDQQHGDPRHPRPGPLRAGPDSAGWARLTRRTPSAPQRAAAAIAGSQTSGSNAQPKSSVATVGGSAGTTPPWASRPHRPTPATRRRAAERRDSRPRRARARRAATIDGTAHPAHSRPAARARVRRRLERPFGYDRAPAPRSGVRVSGRHQPPQPGPVAGRPAATLEEPMSMPPRSRTAAGPLIAGTIIVAVIAVAVVAVLRRRASRPQRLWDSFFPLGGEAPVTDRAHATRSLYDIVFYIAVAIFLAVEGVIVFTAFRYRRKPGDDELPPQTHGNNLVEVIWTAIPSRSSLFLFVISWQTPATRSTPSRPRATSTSAPSPRASSGSSTTSTARQRAPCRPGRAQGHLRAAPAGRRGRRPGPAGRRAGPHHADQPGRHPRLLRAASSCSSATSCRGSSTTSTSPSTPPGTYRGQCAELCGPFHGSMLFEVHALPKADFDTWLAAAVAKAQQTPPPAAVGRRLRRARRPRATSSSWAPRTRSSRPTPSTARPTPRSRSTSRTTTRHPAQRPHQGRVGGGRVQRRPVHGSRRDRLPGARAQGGHVPLRLHRPRRT